jgi:hypothetical protein
VFEYNPGSTGLGVVMGWLASMMGRRMNRKIDDVKAELVKMN